MTDSLRQRVMALLLELVGTIKEDAGPNRDSAGRIQEMWDSISDPDSATWIGYTPSAERGNEWCAAFACWVLAKCGMPLTHAKGQGYYGCGMMIHWLIDRGMWQDDFYCPEPGDLIFLDWRKIGSTLPDDVPVHWKRAAQDVDHVGFVERVEGDIIHTIEGNWRGGVNRGQRDTSSGVIVGYGVISLP